ncbi:MAG: cytochrome C oxidase subunit IV family protein [Deltaproteobacteria bacterium]|nr:cytochrome C oxidase subunit IV family protein [Deltaproteobacteria bacterium]MBI3293159.1 cytochrome C oxidase subunit IV family protein [Deltaproteobacteria bacterium]
MAAAHGHMGVHIKAYIGVFMALIFLTVVTVGVSYLHFSHGMAIAVAMFVATVKGGLVAAVFMHLNNEKKVIYWVLGLTAVLFLLLISIPMMLLCH